MSIEDYDAEVKRARDVIDAFKKGRVACRAGVGIDSGNPWVAVQYSAFHYAWRCGYHDELQRIVRGDDNEH